MNISTQTRILFLLCSWVLVFIPQLKAAEIQQTLVPKAGQSEFTGSLSMGYGNLQGSTSSSVVSVNSNSSVALGRYAYGFSDHFSVSLESGYGQAATNTQVTTLPSSVSRTSNTYRGLQDLNLKARGLFQMGALSVFIAGGYRYPWEKAFLNNDTDYGNRVSRAPALILDTVFMIDSGSVILALESNYRQALAGRYETVDSGISTNYTTSGGSSHSVSLIAEFQTTGHPNISLLTSKTYSQNLTSTAGAITYSEGYALQGLLFGTRRFISETFLLEGFLGYLRLGQDRVSGINVSKYEDLLFGVAGRFYF